jgi:hypothetical protein
LQTNNINYIDPRGIFGSSEIYGIKEYDIAKIYFGLSGYSYFDLKSVNSLNILDDNIDIDIKPIYGININDKIVLIFIMCIWLGNAHCFIDNKLKVVESYYIALFISSKIIAQHFNEYI